MVKTVPVTKLITNYAGNAMPQSKAAKAMSFPAARITDKLLPVVMATGHRAPYLTKLFRFSGA